MKPLPPEAKQAKAMKKYCDYEQQMLAAMRKHGDTYIYGNRKLTITEKNGELTAEWETI